MSGFEMSPFGPVPIGTPDLTNATPEDAAKYLVRKPEAVVSAEPVAQRVQQQTPGQRIAIEPVRPGTLIKQVRARIREIKAELKHHSALQAELAELERLLQAAKQKPKATVRPLRSVG